MFLLLAEGISVRKKSLLLMEGKRLQDYSSSSDMFSAQDWKAAREERGITLGDVSQATKISLFNLAAIEKGEFNKLPPPVYAKAYLKSYAKFLGVNEDIALTHYEKYLKASCAGNALKNDKIKNKKIIFHKRVMIPFFSLLVCFLLWFIIYSQANFRVADISLDCPFLQKSAPPAASLSGRSAAPAVAQGSVKAQQAVAPVTILTQDEAVKQTPVVESPVLSNRLLIVAREETWMRIAEGKKQPYQVLMKPGEQIECSAPEYAIDVGNAAGISIDFQGKKMDNMGKSGEVIHLRLP